MRLVPKKREILILPFLIGFGAKVCRNRFFCRKIRGFSHFPFGDNALKIMYYTTFTPFSPEDGIELAF